MGSSSTRTRRISAGGGRQGTGRKRGSPIVDPANFLLATRDTGYKSSSLAIAELVDNSIQAGSSTIDVQVTRGPDDEYPIEILVVDDGSGMNEETLAVALTFGGSTRFDDRSSLGRYGMGLPNGSLSRARRVEIYSWSPKGVRMSYMDIDEFIGEGRRSLRPASSVERPPFLPSWPTGTAVRLLRCDRLEYRRPSTMARRIAEELGRIYFEFIESGLRISVNGEEVVPTDPLMLRGSGRGNGVRQFGEALRYRLQCGTSEGTVEVRFSELPVARWSGLAAAEKRRMGITNSPTVSVLRSGREIDRGWFFMGSKRRENYDDWWRCEVRFDPALDELFGLTHSKQAIAPSPELVAQLAEDMEPIARALNARVRRRFELLKLSTPLTQATAAITRAEGSLPPLARSSESLPREIADAMLAFDEPDTDPCASRVVLAELPSTTAFEAVVSDQTLVVALNSRHPLLRDVYRPLAASDDRANQETARQLVLTIVAAARAQFMDGARPNGRQRRRFREAWSDVLATYLDA